MAERFLPAISTAALLSSGSQGLGQQPACVPISSCWTHSQARGCPQPALAAGSHEHAAGGVSTCTDCLLWAAPEVWSAAVTFKVLQCLQDLV